MKFYDMRFNKSFLHDLIGKKFLKYRSDPFMYSPSVTGTVGIFIENKTIELRNEQQAVDYFGTTDEYAIFQIRETIPNKLQSFFLNTIQIDMPINEIIRKIVLVNENQQIFEQNQETYDVWLTRGIIFYTDEWEISFEKDTVPFSEEIIIRKGYDLINEFGNTEEFLSGWDEGIIPQCKRDLIVIQ